MIKWKLDKDILLDYRRNNMKICMLSIDFLPNIGGIAAHVYELAKGFVNNGDEVHVITVSTQKRDSFEIIDGIHVHRIYRPDIRLVGSVIYFFSVVSKLRSLISNEKIDVIHTHSILDNMATIFFNVPVIETEHSSGFLENVDKNKKIRFYRFIMNRANHIICPSDELSSYVIQIGINPEKVSYISNGVDTTKFNPEIDGSEIKDKLGIDSTENIVLCPRRLVPKNGVIYLIRSIPYLLPELNVTFLIIGTGPEMEKLKTEVKKLKIRKKIIFLGSVPNREMPKYYSLSSLVVLPSLKEATSISGLEAMATGKPLIGFEIGGIPQIIDDRETGILVTPEREDLLASAMNFLLNNQSKMSLMSEKAYQKVQKEFDWHIVTEKTRDIYENVLKNRK